ncbi:MAG: hypothetical protein OK439_00065 [Thaumarchaeota archaeon]|nr:hypothetical protein [Nitrososphaerota archaeon]
MSEVMIGGFPFNEKNLYDDRLQTWARLDSDDTIVLGLTAFWRSLVGEDTRILINFPPFRIEIQKPFGLLQSARKVDLLYSPINGELIELSGYKESVAAIMPESSNAWFARVKIPDDESINHLMRPSECEEKILLLINRLSEENAALNSTCCG